MPIILAQNGWLTSWETMAPIVFVVIYVLAHLGKALKKGQDKSEPPTRSTTQRGPVPPPRRTEPPRPPRVQEVPPATATPLPKTPPPEPVRP
ncbi:MAG: hypothetical protein KKB50_12990, partial [Planctomycetes bacterium]|nr:hypothetical protein [Planctomycetota bacterium]